MKHATQPKASNGKRWAIFLLAHITALPGLLVGSSTLSYAEVLNNHMIRSASNVRTVAYEYDTATGEITKEIVEPGDSTLCVVGVYEYDSFGNRKNSTTRNCNGIAGSAPLHNSEAPAPVAGSKALFSPRSVSTDYSPDGRFAIKIVNALGQSEERAYDSLLGVPLRLTGPNRLTTSWAYDDWGRKVLEERADGTGTRWTYEYCSSVTVNSAAGPADCPTIAGAVGAQVVTITPVKTPNAAANTDGGANGPYSKTFYDGLGRVIRSVTQGFDGTASGGITTAKLIYQDTEYNTRGLVSRKSRPYFADTSASATQWTEYTYDSLGRLVQEKAPNNGVTKIEYAGLVTKFTNAKNQTRIETKNNIGQLVTITDALNSNLMFRYDPQGNLSRVIDARDNLTSIGYDVKGRKTWMNDPDMGMWTYEYNAIGELVLQTDAKSQIATMTYDRLGRLTAKQEPSLNANWYYDKYKDGSPCTNGIGKLCEATSDNGYIRKHTYDSLGRAVNTATTIGGKKYISATTYVNDTGSADLGRIKDIGYPSGTKLAYVYTPLGHTQKVVNAYVPTSVFWRKGSVDAEGQILQQTYGNNIVTLNTFDPKTGLLSTRKAGSASTSTYQVQNASYGFDSLGNLTSQSDTTTSQSTTYGYDELNRLKNEVRLGSSVTTPTTITWGYNDIGNITSRSDVGTYTYPASVRPHALSGVTGTVNGVLNPSYSYDANGNILTTAGRTVSWTSFNKVNTITATSGSNTTVVALQYDAENERVKETVTKNGTLQKTTIYLNPGAGAGLFYEEETTPTGGKKERHFISAGGGTIGVLIYDWATTKWSTQYWHKDHLGSTVAVTDQVGAVIERMAYEPFGKRRNVNGLTDLLGTLTPTTTDRGFTGHEMMDEVGLVNTNGRIYDPAISRFLSADPTVPHIGDPQSFNRYSYTRNNPLNSVDPSGWRDCMLGDNPMLDGAGPCEFGSGSSQAVTTLATGNGQLACSPSNLSHCGITYGCTAKDGSGACLYKVCTAYTSGGYCYSSQINTIKYNDPSYKPPTKSPAPAPAPAPAPTPAPTLASSSLNTVQHGLNILTFVPGLDIPIGLINASIDLYRGESPWLSLATMAPFFGDAATLMKEAKLARSLTTDAAKGAARSLDELSQAAMAADRGGLTAAGRALQKHGGREGSAFPGVTGGPGAINKQGQFVVDDILTSPGSTSVTRNHARFGEVTEIRAPGGRGVRYGPDGKFIGFLEP